MNRYTFTVRPMLASRATEETYEVQAPTAEVAESIIREDLPPTARVILKGVDLAPAVEALRRVLDKLDTEEDEDVRADLIHHAIHFADSDLSARVEWENYR